jgi:hypothetical protein
MQCVIRQNGTVDSLQLVRGIDERLNANAMNAFKEWIRAGRAKANRSTSKPSCTFHSTPRPASRWRSK